MARYNVDDDWYVDVLKRRKHLIRLVASKPRDDEAMADGLASRAWRLAQEFWKDERKKIPLELFEREGLMVLLDCDLAVLEEDGVYVRGTRDRHEWIRQKAEAGRVGGRRSAESRRAATGSAVPHGASNLPKQNRSSASAGASAGASEVPKRLPKPLVPALAPALALSLPAAPERRGPTTEGAQVWAAYSAAFVARYSQPPIRDAKANTACKALVKAVGLGPAVDLVKFYVGLNDSFYKNAAHPVGLALRDAQALSVRMTASKPAAATEVDLNALVKVHSSPVARKREDKP